MVTRNLYRRPMRTSLTAIGVAVGVVAVVALTTIVRGWWKATDATIHSNEAELMVFQSNIAADLLSVLKQAETSDKLAAFPAVTAVVPMLWHILPIDDRPICLATGVRIEDLGTRLKYLASGRYPTADDEVLVGAIAQRVLAKELGDTLRIDGEAYRIVGVFQTGIVFADGAVVCSLPRLQKIAAREGHVTAFQVHLHDGTDPADVVRRIEERHPELAAVADATDYSKVDQGLGMAQDMLSIVTVVAIVVGSLVIANTMWMSVMERTREIGLLRAVGWPRRRIVLIILLEAAGLGLLAALLGCLAGSGLAKLAACLPGTNQFIEPAFEAAPYVQAVCIALLLSVLGALIPAYRAARISPAEALRYE